MALPLEGIQDFVLSCLDDVEKGRYTDLSLLSQFKVAKKLFEKGSKRTWAGSAKCEFMVKVRGEGNAQRTGLYDQDSSNVVSMMDKGSVGWSMYKTNYSFDRREDIFQVDDWRKILDYIRVKDDNMHEEFWELMEQEYWGKPNSESQFPRPLYGIPAWVVTNASVAAGARNGGNPSGFSSGVGGLNSSDYERWNNWTFGHDGTVTYDGFIQRVTRAMDKCRFRPTHATPRLVPENTGNRYGLYTVRSMYEATEKHLRAQNDNLGRELAKEGPMIRGNVVEWVPYLDVYDSENPGAGDLPFYGIDHQSFSVAKQPGLWMARTKPKEAAGAHNVFTIHMDSAIAMVCHDRSANFVGSFAA